MKAVVFSLGCKVNTYEGQAIINLLEQMGLDVSDKPCYADVYILNTCSVTAEADKKSRQAVERLIKYNRNSKVLVLGCSSQNNADKYLSNPCVSAVSGAGGKIEAVIKFMSDINSGGERFLGTDLPQTYEDNLHPAATRSRGFIKIQDGCNNFCSYCRIPFLRGISRSRSIESVVAEAKEIARLSKEIILTGINVSDYGTSEGGLIELIEALECVPVRKRLSSLECNVIDEDLLKALKKSAFCDHFHLSLQSGSLSVLQAMNRHYTVEEYLSKVELIYKHFPFAAVTTDMIAGFPTETEQDHLESMETARRAKFAAIHVFPYSEREGTEAATFPQIPKAERNRRAAELIKLGTELKTNFLKKNLGRTAEVYAETVKNGISEGFTTNYIRVYSTFKAGELHKVRLIEPYLDGVMGKPVDED